jgi:hypothetical protein
MPLVDYRHGGFFYKNKWVSLRMFIKNFFDIRTRWGIFLFFIFIPISIIPLIVLSGLYGAASYFKSDTIRVEIYIGIYFVINFLFNLLVTRKSPKKWGYLATGVIMPIVITIMFWAAQ